MLPSVFRNLAFRAACVSADKALATLQGNSTAIDAYLHHSNVAFCKLPSVQVIVCFTSK